MGRAIPKVGRGRKARQHMDVGRAGQAWCGIANRGKPPYSGPFSESFSMSLTFETKDKTAPEDLKLLGDGLAAHSAQVGYPATWQDYAVFATDEDGVVRGGLAGNSGQGMFYVRLLWVQAECRRQGVGRTMMDMAEAEAARRGCHTVGVDTFSYQAPQFYPKLGYTAFGQIDGLGDKRDLTRTWFMKRIG